MENGKWKMENGKWKMENRTMLKRFVSTELVQWFVVAQSTVVIWIAEAAFH